MAVAVVFLVVLAFDQLTKWWAMEYLASQESVPVIDGFFKLVLVRNPGVAFGLFPDQSRFFIVVSLIIIVCVLWYYRRAVSRGIFLKISIGLILGGAVGNLIDRIRFSQVIDFLDFDFFDIYIPPFKILFLNFGGISMQRWPAFNIADSAICIGVGILIILSFCRERKTDAPDPA